MSYTKCRSVMQDHLTCGDEEKQKQEVEVEIIENKVSILMLFKGYRQQENTSSSMEDILVTCSKLENKLYILKHQEKGKQITILDC